MAFKISAEQNPSEAEAGFALSHENHTRADLHRDRLGSRLGIRLR